ncbi:P-loop NTPase [Salinisphaera sp. RV14]|uniref:P-loop NTPase n=1 Tax=unclassified Salinisphaera TaxID=2649847 RepID=UPI003F8740AD
MSIVEKAAERLKRQERRQPVQWADDQVFDDAPVFDTREPGQREPLELDDVRLRRVGLLPPESMAQLIGRELQRIKRPILNAMAADASAANRIMITSANPGEGKSFTTFNLALSLANELDHSVLLIDGDVAKPGISRNLGLEREPGLMHLLTHADADPEHCVVPTSEARLSILPAGRRSRRAAESLSSRRMRSVLDELSADPARILLFDSAPLLATAESQALAVNVGQILMLVRAEHTEKRAVEAALSLIEPSGADISLVLSQGHQLFGERHAGYYGMYPAESERTE